MNIRQGQRQVLCLEIGIDMVFRRKKHHKVQFVSSKQMQKVYGSLELCLILQKDQTSKGIALMPRFPIWWTTQYANEHYDDWGNKVHNCTWDDSGLPIWVISKYTPPCLINLVKKSTLFKRSIPLQDL